MASGVAAVILVCSPPQQRNKSEIACCLGELDMVKAKNNEGPEAVDSLPCQVFPAKEAKQGSGRTQECTLALTQFQSMAKVFGAPLAPEKTEGPSTCLVFLGIQLDTVKMEARLPQEKVMKIIDMLEVAIKAPKL
ncbi:hypothetical protein NDU88_007065 [Pleurodeles waltl]|uniref:Uncharacterized protein n=1 Tax=Pleurodeles waltl TaxID=8319 RepID=A0AAV7UMU3_PLEWA|nr:hypothetical protein NDU88_007065 [Pleurodeles waltl]